jgi:hypothetical protein
MRPITKSLIVGISTIVTYLVVVVITTPALEPFDSINAAFQINAIVIFGMGLGIAIQVFLSEKSKSIGCKLDSKKKVFGGSSGSTTVTSFFSFFSLVPLGCCGWWLYALSLLPSIVGTGISAILIEHSQTLAYLGLSIVFGFNGLTAYKIHKSRYSQSPNNSNSHAS